MWGWLWVDWLPAVRSVGIDVGPGWTGWLIAGSAA